MPQILEHGEVETVVRKHAEWVHACACRRVRGEAMAEDVTQAVFILLWRKWGRLGKEVKMTGWLYRALRHCAAEALRAKGIRERHEREAAMAGRREKCSGEAVWGEVSPELEAAVDRLGKADREAVLLRFYRQMSFVEVGECLGISEKAARKRVERAVEKLREKLAGKGVEVEAGSLGTMVLAHAAGGGGGMEGGAAGLVEKVMAGIGGGGGNGTAGLIAKGAMKMMVMAKVKVAAVVVVMAALMAGVTLAAAGRVGSTAASNPSGIAADGASKVPDQQADAFLTSEAVLQGWEASYGAVRSFDVSYILRQDDKSAKGATTKPASYGETDAIVDGEKFHVRHTTDPLGLNKGTIVQDDAFDGNIGTSYQQSERRGTVSPGRLYGSKETFCLFFMHLGRMAASPDMAPQVVGKLQLLNFHRDYANGGTVRPEVSLRSKLEVIAGEPCHVLEVNPAGAGIKTVTWFAHEKGMAVVRQELSVAGIFRAYEVSQLGSTPTDTGVFWFPARATMKFRVSGKEGMEQEFECRKFIPNPKVDDSAFRVAFPEGTRVFKTAEGRGRMGYVWRNGKAEPFTGQD